MNDKSTGSPARGQLEPIARALGFSTIMSRLKYPLRQKWYEARFGPNRGGRRTVVDLRGTALGRRQTGVDLEALGDLRVHAVEGPVIDLFCDNGVLRLESLAEDLIRFRLRPAESSDFPEVFSYALDPDAQWAPNPITLEDSAQALTIRTKRLTCRITKSPCRLTFLDPQGQPLSEPAGGLGFRGEGVFCTRRLVEGEALYGLGEKAFDLNLRGRRLEMWNRDPEIYAPGDDPINLNIPMLIGLHEGRAYGLFFDNPGRARFDLGQAKPDRLCYEADTGDLCGCFFAGPTIPEVLERYTQLTGRMPLPPRWMLGFHQSRWSYHPASQVREVAAEFRERRIPCDVVHLDIHHLDGYRIFTWDPDRFPDPPGLLADLRQQGFRTIGIVDPGVKADPGYAVHDEGMRHGSFCRLPDGSLFRGPVWPGECYFPDFTDPQVRTWWGKLYKPFLEAGVAGFWNDMNEPAIFGGEMPGSVFQSHEGRGAAHSEIHNVYGLQMARASAEGLRRLRPDERVPLISRSGYAGLQRHALVWTADNQSTWAQLRLSVSMCLNLGLSGVAFCGPDVGGFSGNCNGELLARWTQVGALMPFFRNHSALGTVRQEPWAFGEPYESICRRWIELRYRLLPYIYTAAWQAAQSGQPMMRPLALAFPEDLRTYSLDDEFLLGDALLAAPIGYPGQTRRRVYLPSGPWYDFWTGKQHCGEVTVDAPLERMPLFVRAGTVLPMGPVMQHTGEWPPPVLQVHIFAGDGESLLYEDDGHSLSYKNGNFCITRFACELADDGLALRRLVEGPFRPGYDRFEITIHGAEVAPRQVLLDGQPVPAAHAAEQGIVQLTVGPWSELRVIRSTGPEAER